MLVSMGRHKIKSFDITCPVCKLQTKILKTPILQMQLLEGGAQGISANRNLKKKLLEKRKSFKNQQQQATDIGVLPNGNALVVYCYSQILHFLTDSKRDFAILSSNMH